MDERHLARFAWDFIALVAVPSSEIDGPDFSLDIWLSKTLYEGRPANTLIRQAQS